MYCEQCGKEISEKARFCGNCGIPVKRVGIKGKPEKPLSKHKTGFMIIIIACVTVIFGIGIVLFLRGKKYDSIANQEDGQWLLSRHTLTEYNIYHDDDAYIAEWREYEYDSQGSMIKIIEYNEEGDVVEESVYNRDGILIKQIKQEFHGNEFYKEVWEYDEKKNVTRVAEYSLTGDLISETNYINDYEYDAQGNLIEAIFYYDGKFNHREEYQYDAEGRLLHSLMYFDKPEPTLVTDYEYDDMGGWTEHKYYPEFYPYPTEDPYSDDPLRSLDSNYLSWETAYDAYGNLTKRYIYNTYGELRSSYTCKYEYDTAGNIIKEHAHEKDEYGESDKLFEYGIVEALDTDICWGTLLEETEGLFGLTTKWNVQKGLDSISGEAEMQYEYDKFGKLIKATVVSGVVGESYYPFDSMYIGYPYDEVETIEIEYFGGNISKVTYCDAEGNMLRCEEYEYILLDT